MNETFVYGSFNPPYLLIRINTNQALTNFKSVDPYEQRIFFHEYTHFLQSIAGGFGHSDIWNTFDRLRQVIASLQKTNATELPIPVRNETMEKEILFIKAMKAIKGDSGLPLHIDPATAKIDGYSCITNEAFETLYPGSNQPFLNLNLIDDSGKTCQYAFGDIAVSEMMAWLMESKFFETDAAPNFPYHVCELLAEKMGTDLLKNKEFLFALCDVALMSNFPGIMFYKILLEMQQKKFVPARAEDVFDYGLKFMYDQGWKIFEDFENNKNGANTVIGEMFKHPLFKETLIWFQYILDIGYEFRLKNPYFMLQLYRADNPFSGLWVDVNYFFGTPQVHNALEERFFSAPNMLKKIEDKIEPLLLLAAKQLHDTLILGTKECHLIDCCNRALIGAQVDDRCYDNPWEKAKDEVGCAYAALWAGYGLSDKNVITDVV